MNLKDKLSSFFPSRERSPLVRIDGSLSGNALFEEGGLGRLKQVVEAVSAERPYSYDLDLSGGRFSVLLVDAVIPFSSFVSDPEADIAQDLQNIVEALPPPERSQLQCTFRALWHQGGEVTGVAFLIVPPGRVNTERRIRQEAEYDLLAEQQALTGYSPTIRTRLPRWAVITIGVAALIVVSLFMYHTSPEREWQAFVLTLDEKMELDGFSRWIEVRDFETDMKGMRFTLYPLEGCAAAMATTRDGPEEELAKLEETVQEKAAREALAMGRVYLEYLDDSKTIVDRIPLDLSGFDGVDPLPVQSRLPGFPMPYSQVRLYP